MSDVMDVLLHVLNIVSLCCEQLPQENWQDLSFIIRLIFYDFNLNISVPEVVDCNIRHLIRVNFSN